MSHFIISSRLVQGDLLSDERVHKMAKNVVWDVKDVGLVAAERGAFLMLMSVAGDAS